MTPQASRILELRINSPSVRIYPIVLPPTISDDIIPGLAGNDMPSGTSICLLRGSVDEFTRYSRQEGSKWLIDIAHDICDPADQRGLLLLWKEHQQQWCLVDSTDPLTTSIYSYELPDGVTVGLSKISQRDGTSVTSTIGNPSTMTDRVKSRDEQCWVTEAMPESGVNSHIVPRRMGDHVARTIFQTFTSLTPPPTLSVYNEMFGLCMAHSLDRFFDHYRMGFRFVTQNLYQCHSFINEEKGYLTFAGLFKNIGRHIPVHGIPVQPPHPERDNVPPPGLFRWHYLQCVIKKFAHDDYRQLANIDHYELPVRMRGDSDDEGPGSEAEWPSMALDLGRAAANALEEREESRRAVEAWISNA